MVLASEHLLSTNCVLNPMLGVGGRAGRGLRDEKELDSQREKDSWKSYCPILSFYKWGH